METPDGHPRFRLRELAPGDGAAVGALIAASPDTGMIRLLPKYKIDPYQALTFGGHESGVVVESDALEGLAGMGMVRFGEASIHGERRPSAYLYSLVVHPAVRRQGMARAIADWRLTIARGRFGPDVVIVAAIQQGNAGSFANARAWATQFPRPLIALPLSMLRSPPSQSPGVRVRPARSGDLAEFAARSKLFHDHFDLWSPATEESLTDWLGRSPIATPINELWVVEDTAGNILGGLGTSESRGMATVHIESMPAGLRALNLLVRLVPRGGVLEEVAISKFWFQPGRESAGAKLLKTVRWELRTRGNVALFTFDPLGPAGRVIRRSRFQISSKVSLAIRSPLPIRPDWFISPIT